MKIFAIALMILMCGTASAAGQNDSAGDAFRSLQKNVKGGSVPQEQPAQPTQAQPTQTQTNANEDIWTQFQFYDEKVNECMAAEFGGVGVYDKVNCPKYSKSLNAIIDYCEGKKIKPNDKKACSEVQKEIENREPGE